MKLVEELGQRKHDVNGKGKKKSVTHSRCILII